MFTRLKTRLTLLNLAVAGLILLAVTVIAFALLSSNIQKNSEQMLDVVANNLNLQLNNFSEFDAGIVLKSAAGIFPYIIIEIGENGAIYTGAKPMDGKDVAKFDQKMSMIKDQVNKIVQSAMEQEAKAKKEKLQVEKKQIASIDKLSAGKQPDNIITLEDGESYRYRAIYSKKTVSGSMMYLILQDMSSEKALQASMGLTLGACVLGGLLLMALGGLFLAERSIRPVRVAWQKQRDFVADASHELRTPLAAIIGNIDVVMDDPKAQVEEKQVFCEGIYEEAGRMSVLVDGLLMLARADSDTLVFEKEPVEIAELVRSSATFMQPVAAKKNIQLELKILNVPVVEGDGGRLKQVVLQLLDNAVKYTPRDGRVEIRVESIRDAVELKVVDNGIGMTPEHQKKIFERFFRVDQSRENEVGGHGLGLSIAKYIVENHGGSISVTSERGRGSTFTVILPDMIIH